MTPPGSSGYLHRSNSAPRATPSLRLVQRVAPPRAQRTQSRSAGSTGHQGEIRHADPPSSILDAHDGSASQLCSTFSNQAVPRMAIETSTTHGTRATLPARSLPPRAPRDTREVVSDRLQGPARRPKAGRGSFTVHRRDVRPCRHRRSSRRGPGSPPASGTPRRHRRDAQCRRWRPIHRPRRARRLRHVLLARPASIPPLGQPRHSPSAGFTRTSCRTTAALRPDARPPSRPPRRTRRRRPGEHARRRVQPRPDRPQPEPFAVRQVPAPRAGRRGRHRLHAVPSRFG